jgi:Uma2 family endonuclease
MIQTSLQISIPPLESGDHLSRVEFERRYQAMPHIKKAELIEGVVFVASPLRLDLHARPHGQIMVWLGTYEASIKGLKIGDNPTVRLDLDNEPQPDAVLLIVEALGGQSRLSEDGYIEGAPELVVEVAASSVSNDLYTKKTAYRRNGVKEYIIWQVLDRKLTWFILSAGQYVEQDPDAEGIFHSSTFPGLWLDAYALINDDMQQVLKVLQQGIQSPEHQIFMENLIHRQQNS